MSSILEALRELEGDKARASGKKATSVADAPREPERSLSALIPLTGGLAIGVVAFGVYVAWSAGVFRATTPEASAPPEAVRSAPDAAPSGPEWLERAEAPRARVTPPPAAAPPRPAPAAASATVASGAPAAAFAPALPKVASTKGSGADQQVQLEGISYSANVDQRTATLRVNGRRATLRQRETLGGVEVQLIMSDGVYLQRGSDVFFVARPR
jgi:hypothetical protein